jgi:AcrR family transcriptional regulator
MSTRRGNHKDMTRKYELKQRAQSQAETRQRIVEATVELHTSLGPARTTISAIAERAGVQRLTVYRHFPDERALFHACTRHSWAENPLPDPSAWAALGDPEERLRVGLGEIYAFFRANEELTANVRRDLPDMPVMREVAAPYAQHWEDIRAALERGWKTNGRRRRKLLHAVIGHAVEFETWRSLARNQGLEDVEVVELMVGLAHGVPGSG